MRQVLTTTGIVKKVAGLGYTLINTGEFKVVVDRLSRKEILEIGYATTRDAVFIELGNRSHSAITTEVFKAICNKCDSFDLGFDTNDISFIFNYQPSAVGRTIDLSDKAEVTHYHLKHTMPRESIGDVELDAIINNFTVAVTEDNIDYLTGVLNSKSDLMVIKFMVSFLGLYDFDNVEELKPFVRRYNEVMLFINTLIV